MTIIGYLFKRVSAFVKNSRPKLKLRAKILKTQGKNPKLKEKTQPLGVTPIKFLKLKK